MKGTALLALAGIITLALAQNSRGNQGSTIFSDGFETGNLSLWTASGTSPLASSGTNNASPAGGLFSAKATLTLNRMHHNIIADNGGAEVSGASSLTAWIYDGSMGRAYVQAAGYSGTGYPNGGNTADGSLQQALSIGKFDQAGYDATKYQARILYGTVSGWFNLNDPGAPSRSPGWHKFTIERDSDNTTIKFYVDDILSKTVTGSAVQSWDTLTLGVGSSSTQNGETFYDGIAVVVPEPGPIGLVLFGLGLLVCWRRFAK